MTREQEVQAAYDAGHRTYQATARAVGCDWSTARYWFRKLGLVPEAPSPETLKEKVLKYRAEGYTWSRVAGVTQTSKATLYRLAEEWGIPWGDEPPPFGYKRDATPAVELRRCPPCGGMLRDDVPHVCRRIFHPTILGIA